jgi:heat shock protein 5
MLFFVLASISVSDEDQKPLQRIRKVIGIDLGTRYSCVAVWQNGTVELIPNEDGSTITASVVSFGANPPLVGDAAMEQMTTDPENTIVDIMRIMGLPFDDETLQNEIKPLPYRVVNQGNHPYIQVKFRGRTELFSPEEICAMILEKMKKIAEKHLGGLVTSAVITVPAYFNHAQRKATIDAAKIAGLNVIRILNKPTAAALAYRYERLAGQWECENILAFDLGGGKLDISVIHVDYWNVEVLATNGDTHLGGQDFDERVIAELADRYKNKTGNDTTGNRKAMAMLRREAEKVRRNLSSVDQVTIEIENFNDGDDFVETLTRARFEELNADLFRKTMSPVQNAIKDSGLSKSGIDDVVLVGGSSRIPKIQQLIRDFFNGKELSKSINPEEAIAHGAAIQAALLSDEVDTLPVILANVNPLTLGIETVGGVLSTLIPRNSKVPTVKSKIFTTFEDNQEQVKIQVFESESLRAKDNNLLGSFSLMGIRPAPKGVPQINVTFELNSDGTLRVSAEDKAANVKSSIKIEADDVRLSDAQLKRAINKARGMRDDDEMAAQATRSKSRLKRYLIEAESRISDREMREKITEGLAWLSEHADEPKDVYNQKFVEIQERIGPLLVALSASEAA